MSGLFGGGQQPQQQQPTSTTVTNTNLPAWAQPYSEKILGQASALTDINQNPYQQYQGQRLADFTPMQQQAFNTIGGMQVSPQNQQATGLAGMAGLGSLGAGQQYNQMATNPGAVSAFMSPYQQNVTDYQKQQAVMDYNRAAPAQQAQATNAGAFGGSRQAIVEGEAQRNLQNQLAGIQATGSQNAFQNAQQAQQFGANLGMQGYNQALQGANTLGQLGQNQYGQQTGINAAQQQAGAQQQAFNQQGLTNQYQDFLNQQNYPYQQLGFMSDILHGTPTGGVTSAQTSQAAPSMMSQIGGSLGGIGSLAGAYNAYNKAEGGEIKSYAEGGDVTGQPLGLGSLVDQQTAVNAGQHGNKSPTALQALALYSPQIAELQQQQAQKPTEDVITQLAAMANPQQQPQQPQQPQPQQMARGMPPRPEEEQQMADGGLASLPSNNFNPENYAGGGIIAFAEGDEVKPVVEEAPAPAKKTAVQIKAEAKAAADAVKDAVARARVGADASTDMGQRTTPAKPTVPAGEYDPNYKSVEKPPMGEYDPNSPTKAKPRPFGVNDKSALRGIASVAGRGATAGLNLSRAALMAAGRAAGPLGVGLTAYEIAKPIAEKTGITQAVSDMFNDDDIKNAGLAAVAPSEPAKKPDDKTVLDMFGKAESSGGKFNENPNSSASGMYGITAGTFEGIKKNNPDLPNVSFDEFKALKPEEQAVYASALQKENQQRLTKANIPLTPLNQYTMWFSGDTKLARAGANAPISSVLSETQIAANPWSAGKTVGEVRGILARNLSGKGTTSAAAPATADPTKQGIASVAPEQALGDTSQMSRASWAQNQYANPTTTAAATPDPKAADPYSYEAMRPQLMDRAVHPEKYEKPMAEYLAQSKENMKAMGIDPEKHFTELANKFSSEAAEAKKSRNVGLWMSAAQGFFAMAAQTGPGSQYALANFAKGAGVGAKEAEKVLGEYTSANKDIAKASREMEIAKYTQNIKLWEYATSLKQQAELKQQGLLTNLTTHVEGSETRRALAKNTQANQDVTNQIRQQEANTREREATARAEVAQQNNRAKVIALVDARIKADTKDSALTTQIDNLTASLSKDPTKQGDAQARLRAAKTARENLRREHLRQATAEVNGEGAGGGAGAAVNTAGWSNLRVR